MSVLHWLLPIVGIGFVIFFHELGHFMAARATGVRVEAFSIGFGPRLFGFKRGSTDWKICLIPLGGFVKMAGETPGSEKTGAKDEFSSKTVAQRSLIISAGVIMNVIFALIALPIAFMMGVPFESPVIGSVEPGGPAWREGLRASDRVVSVHDRRTLGFEDVLTGIAIGGDVVTLDAERGGQRIRFDIPTRRDERRGLPVIGIGASLAAIEIRPKDVDPDLADDDTREAAAHRRAAGLKPGDRIVAVDGIPISDQLIRGSEIEDQLLTVVRDGKEIRIVVPALLSKPKEGEASEEALEKFGLGAADLTVKEIVRGSPAAAVGLKPGDRIARIDGQEVLRFVEMTRALASATGPVTVLLERDQKVVPLAGGASDPDLRRSLRADVDYAASGRMVVPITGGAAARAGLGRGDEIVAINGTPIERYQDITQVDPKVRTVTFTVRRGGAESGPTDVTVTRAPVPINRALGDLEHEFLREVVRTGLKDSLAAGFDYTVMMTARVFMTLKSLFSNKVSAKNLGGIITIFSQSKESSKIAFSRGLLFLAVISINLAVLNVLPIPVLDGGWLLLLLIEKLRGRPVSERVLGVVSWIGFGLILGLMVFATWNDIRRL